MIQGGGSGHPPPPAPAPDYPGSGVRVSPEFSGGRRQDTASPERRGRSRTAERPRQGPVRRIRSSGPAGPQQPPDIGELRLRSERSGTADI